MAIVINSVYEFIEAIKQERTVNNQLLWFRGHRDCRWEVKPTVWRDYDKNGERHLTNTFCARAGTRYGPLPQYNDSAAWLSLMQHYGLPTRLLDWSRSPLVAIYFAIESYLHEKQAKPVDAGIWVLKPHLLNQLEGLGSVAPSISAHICNPMISPAFSHRSEENNKVMAAMAAESDMRMFVQQGCFTIHSDQQPLTDKIGSEQFLSEYIIPAERIFDVAQTIDVMGFRKGDIYPDLTNLAIELRSR